MLVFLYTLYAIVSTYDKLVSISDIYFRIQNQKHIEKIVENIVIRTQKREIKTNEHEIYIV